MSLKITYQFFFSNLPGTNELTNVDQAADWYHMHILCHNESTDIHLKKGKNVIYDIC